MLYPPRAIEREGADTGDICDLEEASVHDTEESVDTWVNAESISGRDEAPCVTHRRYGFEALGAGQREAWCSFGDIAIVE